MCAEPSAGYPVFYRNGAEGGGEGTLNVAERAGLRVEPYCLAAGFQDLNAQDIAGQEGTGTAGPPMAQTVA